MHGWAWRKENVYPALLSPHEEIICLVYDLMDTKKRFLVGTSLLIGSVSFVGLWPRLVEFLFFFFLEILLSPEILFPNRPKRPIWKSKHTSDWQRRSGGFLWASQFDHKRENWKLVAWFLSHYYSNRRQKIVSHDNFPLAWDNFGLSPSMHKPRIL